MNLHIMIQIQIHKRWKLSFSYLQGYCKNNSMPQHARKQQGRSRNKEEEGYEEESGGKRLQPIRARFLLKEEKEGKKAD